ncbi:hypothetical protein [Thermotalea metallivorans]|nr:hypothetical protein [Thermotalea metallivorans]
MIIIFMLIIVGGLIGLGIHIRNGYPIHTFEYQSAGKFYRLIV